MPGRLEGKVAFITGAARGQGRSHALRLAEEGADIIAVDLCGQIDTVPYPMSTPADLAETVAAVEALDRRIVARQADVRDGAALRDAVAAGVAELGGIDIVLANAGIFNFSDDSGFISEEAWRDVIDTNLTGVWNTITPAVPHLRRRGGGAVVITSSVAGNKGLGHMGHYVAAKHGVVGLMRTLAIELAPDFIRVNAIHPTNVNTQMIQNEPTYHLFSPDLEHPSHDDFIAAARGITLLPVPWVEAIDISNAVLFLVSDEGRYITGISLPVDAGQSIK
ncbi:MAG TPA: mycofactocin-coupled SDR family oxidoreductase [Trebonia sp.]|jgi:SDR family mycofactocin-dependent oxidoreductase|nr:mycofactocin-coupled SDR family oxidoreductase [Trebonia sp.]